MASIKLNTHFGTLNIYKRGKKGTYQLNIFFKDIGKDNHYRASIGTNQRSLAEPKALDMAKAEYERRMMGIKLQKNITPYTYMEHKFIPWLESQLGKTMDNKPSRRFSATKIKLDKYTINRWWLPLIKGKRWEEIQHANFGRNVVHYLRNVKTVASFKDKNGIEDATICSYIGVFNRFMRRANHDGYVAVDHVQGVPPLLQASQQIGQYSPHAYAVFTDEMMYELLDYLGGRVKKAKRKDLHRTYTQSYALCRIFADTGIRPFMKPPLTFEMFEEATTTQGEPYIRLRRQEKAKRYNAQGRQMTIDALDDLRELYFSEGTNINQNPGLPIIHHAPCGNGYGGVKVEPYQQIHRSHETIKRAIRDLGWFDLKDNLGRRYRNYSIRKWHINKSIELGEDRFQIAERVGHSYAVLEKFYLDVHDKKQTIKGDIWGTRNKNPMIKSWNDND